MKKLNAWNEAIKATTIRDTDSPQRKKNLQKIREEVAETYGRWGEGARSTGTKPTAGRRLSKSEQKKLDAEIDSMIRKNGGKR